MSRARRHIPCVLTILLFSLMAASAHCQNGPSWRILIDPLGRTVRVPADPQRVIALAPNITEIIFALGQQARLVGVTRFADYPPAAADYPKVGSYVQLDIERILALRPDVCLAIKDGNPKAVADRLTALHIPVYVVDPRNLASVMQAIAALGELLHAQTRAQALIGDMQQRLERVAQRVQTRSHTPRVFFQIGITPIVSVGSDTFIHELIVLAGGHNVAEGPAAYPRFSREQVLAAAPDVIIITSMDRMEIFERVQAEWMQWQELPAARHGRVYIQDSNVFDRAGPRLMEGLELLVELIQKE